MTSQFEAFYELVRDEKKEEALTMAMELLEKESCSIRELYESYLRRSLNELVVKNQPQGIDIWQEHVSTGIIRTIIENAYPYVMAERREKGLSHKKKIAILCPEGEHHEIGPRMIADYFTIFGYEVIFVGANTPIRDYLLAARTLDLDYIAISVTSYYNLVHAKRIITALRADQGIKAKIIVGGNAFEGKGDLAQEIGADLLLTTYEEIGQLQGGEQDVSL